MIDYQFLGAMTWIEKREWGKTINSFSISFLELFEDVLFLDCSDGYLKCFLKLLKRFIIFKCLKLKPIETYSIGVLGLV